MYCDSIFRCFALPGLYTALHELKSICIVRLCRALSHQRTRHSSSYHDASIDHDAQEAPRLREEHDGRWRNFRLHDRNSTLRLLTQYPDRDQSSRTDSDTLEVANAETKL